MAFTGTATVTQVSDRIVRITGVALASAAAGIIGLNGHTGASVDVALPDAFNTGAYKYASATVTLADAIECVAQAAALGVATAIPLAIVKTGTTEADFRLTITNTHGSLATPNLEIYITFH